MLNEALRLVRVFHDINQSKMAKKLDISRSYLSEIESGKKTTSIEILDKYSIIFDIPSSSILLFSEKLESNTFTEKTRVVVASKILKIMNWLSETGSVKDGKHAKQE
jgi:transcriptional regulator with XRE-family HTH domain